MFGDVAFAQAPFAALGGNTFPVAIQESASVTTTSNFDVVYGGIINEGATVTTTATGRSSAYAIVYETINVFETLYANGSIFVATVSEVASVSTTNTVTAAELYARVNEEAAVVVAAPSAVSTVYGAIAESVTGTDTSSRGAGLFAAMSEAATGADTSSNTAIYSVTVAEQATGNDNPSAFSLIVVTPSGVQLYIAVGNSLVWGIVDDAQDPNWTLIQT